MSATDGAGRDRGTSEGARLAEEIRLLVDLVTERAEPWLESVVAAGHGQGPDGCTDTTTAGASAPSWESGSVGEDAGSGRTATAPGADGGACGWCPLCAVVELVRGEAPEVAARVLEQAAQLIALLRAVLADRWQPEDGVHMPGFDPPPRPDPAEGSAGTASSRRVQRVAVRQRERWEP